MAYDNERRGPHEHHDRRGHRDNTEYRAPRDNNDTRGRREDDGYPGRRQDDDRRGRRDDNRFEGRNSQGRQRSGARLRHDGHRSAAAPSQRRRMGDPARAAAYEVLRATSEGAYANLEMPRILRRNDLRGRDAAFATELALGTIRQQGLYDRIIEVGAGRSARDIDPAVLDVLRLGAHQLLGMRVPTHAATSETVALAREKVGAGAAGFVNAVLRRVGERERDTWIADLTRNVSDEDEIRAIETSHPTWIISALRGALKGHEASEKYDEDLDQLLKIDNIAPLVSLVARPGLASVDELLEADAEPDPISPVGAILHSGDPGDIPAIRQARAAVQDAGSQLIALALAAADVEPAGEKRPEEWLDMCAGPGGKAALLGALAHERGAILYCNEVSEHRSELVRRTMRPLLDDGAEIFIGTGDGRELGVEEPNTYDRVLVDAPCTGLGAMRRRPESRWRRKPSDVAELATLQKELLNSAIDATRPGGVIGYATCSPHVAETLSVVSSVIASRNDVIQENAWPLFKDAEGDEIGHHGDLPSVQLWPHIHGTDAMFFALLRKK